MAAIISDADFYSLNCSVGLSPCFIKHIDSCLDSVANFIQIILAQLQKIFTTLQSSLLVERREHSRYPTLTKFFHIQMFIQNLSSSLFANL
ncbi:unnamed protein product [Ceratitis capitata]|uniref:(Mediterranean fruit fly) hypothetical protein n=1 Tax=Ceratitis capitata TaxID=7213 RepID=A0A811V8C2_CERCA|nr:unnamed protein product [Ceratitis capitata]